ncbi:MAG: sulfatase-like hydrolase/transferase [Spirochaetes bacterium]|nr:sulfatase-like hydrolase/transferase [Spirochaetota bacterium]
MSESGRRNALLIMVDQWNAGCFSYAGHPDVRTPAIDALAADGLVFADAFCQSPVCLPSRVSLLSGQYPHHHRQYGFEGMQGGELPLLPRAFSAAGYGVALIGKLHVASLPADLGADFVATTLAEDAWRASHPGATYGHFAASHGYDFPTDQIHGAPASPRRALDPLAFGTSEIALEHSVERWVADQALAYLDRDDAGIRPFFLWMSFDRPHHPWTPSAPYDRLYDPRKLSLSPVATGDQIRLKPSTYFRDLAVSHAKDPAAFRKLLSHYYGVMAQVDGEIGRVVARLKEKGLYESTDIVFCADHGDGGGVAGQFEKASGVSSVQVTRVPLVFKPAGVAAPRRAPAREIVELVDLAPTLLALHGLPPLAGPQDGRDLSPILGGAPGDPARLAMCEGWEAKAIYSSRYALVWHAQLSFGELYDRLQDPEERQNRYTDASLAPVRRVLKLELAKKLSPPWNGDDEALIDGSVLGHPVRHRKWSPRSPLPGERFGVIQGRGLAMVNSTEYQAFIRLDGRASRIYRLPAVNLEGAQDPRIEIADADGAIYEAFLDGFLGWLFRRIPPIDIVENGLVPTGLPATPPADAVARFVADPKGYPTRHRFYQRVAADELFAKES